MGCGSSRSPVRVGILSEDDDDLYPGKGTSYITRLEVSIISCRVKKKTFFFFRTGLPSGR